jgi:hypothetical protein
MKVLSMNKPPPQPPQPPEFDRKLQFYPFHLLGIALLILVPVLALLGVFGETSAVVQGASNGIELEVHYSNRIHFQGLDGTEIRIRNTTGNVISSLTVAIDKAFLDNFSDLAFTPEVTQITEAAYLVELSEVQPGETRIVTYDSRGKIAGSHLGNVTVVSADNGPTVVLETLIIP